MPITWQNVNTRGDAPAMAASPLAAAGTSVNSAFDIFNKLLNQHQDIEASNVQANQEALKQAFLDKVATAKTPEELAQLQQSGALDAAKAGMGTKSLAAVRGADEARMTAVRQNQTAATAFDDAVRTHTEAPKIGAIKDLALQGKFPEAKAALAAAGLYDPSATEAFIHTTEQTRQAESEHNHDRPYQEASLERAKKEGDLKLTEDEYQAKETARTRALDTAANSIIAERQAKVGEVNRVLSDVANNFDKSSGLKDSEGNPIVLPRNSDGTLAADRLTGDLATKFKEYAKKIGAPATLDDLKGDTGAYKNGVEALRKIPGTKETDLVRLAPVLQAGLNTGFTPPIGRDAAIIDRNQRIQDFNAKMDASLYVPMTTPGAAGDARKAAFEEIEKRIPAGWERDNWKQEIATLIDKGGIEAVDPKTKKKILDGNGQPIRVVPGPDAIRDLIVGTDRGVVGWGAGDLRSAIDAWKNNSTHQFGAGAAVNNQMLNGIRNIDAKR